MPSLTYFVASSLDGFIADPDGDFSAFATDGDHIAHLVAEFPETMPGHVRSALGIDDRGSTFDTVVMGWNTFAVGLDAGVTSPYPHLRQLVFSRHDRAGEVGGGVEVVADDPHDVIDQIRAESSTRDIWLCGGGQLAGELAGSIDRIVLKVNPIVLGSGVPLFGALDCPLTSFTLTRPPRSFDSGVVILDYARRR